MDEPGALTGLRVIDAATLAAGPLVATALGELGADVVKVEQPGTGDPMRRWGERKDGIGLVWKSISRNKRCITLDLRQTDGQDLLHRLLDLSDVLIVNNRPSALTRWDLDPPAVVARHPRLVVLHVSGFGAGGPYSDRPGFGTLAEAMSGFAHVVGEAGGPPTLPPFMLADGVASMAATYAVLAALYHRDVHGGAGQYIDINLIEPLARLIESATLTYDQLGWSPTRSGNRWDTSAPRNAFPTADDRWIAMSSAAPAIAQRVFRAIGRKEWADDPDFVDPVARQDHATQIDTAVAAWIAARTLDEAMAVFEAAQVAAAPVYDAEHLLADPHLTARGTYPTIDDPELGPMRVQAPIARLSATPGRIDHLGPPLGADNDDIYGRLLGLDPSRVAELRAAGVI
jgi:crotonobetainyl-CoA:carnitine CoA-transferase CaiB-like acyl-CoA transferase